MWARIRRLFQPLDTSAVDRAIAEAEGEHRQVRVRARALRMDVSCGDPSGAVRRVRASLVAHGWALQRRFGVDGPTPPDMLGLADRIV